jgi:hypothetical protein
MLNPKNAPEAKPVKIRIMSGGEEHSSLDSLRQNFNLEDIEKLLDGRLVNWLYKIGEVETAKEIEKIEKQANKTNKDQMHLDLIRVFFDEKKKKLYDVACLWLKKPQYKKNIYNLISSDFETASQFSQFGTQFYDDIDWIKIFEHHLSQNPTNAQMFYDAGVGLSKFENNVNYKNVATKYIWKSARLGYTKAKLMLSEKFCYYRNYSQKQIQAYKHMLNLYYDVDTSNEFWKQTAYYSIYSQVGDERNFIRDYGFYNANRNKTVFSNDPFYREKAFVLFLYYCHQDLSTSFLMEDKMETFVQEYNLDINILLTYPLFSFLVNRNEHFLTEYEIDTLETSSLITNKLKIVVKHLLDF